MGEIVQNLYLFTARSRSYSKFSFVYRVIGGPACGYVSLGLLQGAGRNIGTEKGIPSRQEYTRKSIQGGCKAPEAHSSRPERIPKTSKWPSKRWHSMLHADCRLQTARVLSSMVRMQATMAFCRRLHVGECARHLSVG